MEREQPEQTNMLAAKFEGVDVKVFLINGHIMVGTAHFSGKYLHVKDHRNDNEAIINMDHVISMSRR